MLRNKGKLKSKNAKFKNSLIQPAKAYKSKSQKESKVKLKRIRNIVLNKSIYAFILILSITISGYLFLKVRSNTKALESNITNKGFECRDHPDRTFIKTVLRLKKDSAGNLNDFNLIIFNSEKAISVDFNKVVFDINKNGREGTLNDYFNLNRTYVSEDDLIKNLPNLFLSNFYIKVDNLILESDYNIDTYLIQKNESFFSKLSLKAKISESQKIRTTVCLKSWDKFIGEYSKVIKWNATNVGYGPNFKLTNYFQMPEIKKEQIRVQLINKSGVDNLGIFYGKLLDNYGINVVKNDDSTDKISKTRITKDNAKSLNTNTVNYLIDLISYKGNVEEESSLFSDVTVEVGEDGVINY